MRRLAPCWPPPLFCYLARMSPTARTCVVILTVLAWPAAADGQAAPYLDPSLHMLARLGREPVPVGLTPSVSGTLGAIEVTAAGPVVHALARLGRGGEAALRDAGARISTRAGDIVTVRFPLAALGAVAGARGVVALEAGSRMVAGGSAGLPSTGNRPGPAGTSAFAVPNDVSSDEIGVAELRRLVGDRFAGITGRGVIIGIYDSGLDLQHGDFLRPDGSTRVVAAWDQTVQGGTPPGVMGPHNFDYGHVCTPADIDDGLCPLDDTHGHGTHVAGTAAGDGSATGHEQQAYRFAGAAPEADLVIVRGDTASTFPPDGVVDGVAYVFAVAEQMGRPAVVVLSLGRLDGPHDGTSLVEQALDNLSGPGRVIVAAHGNRGANGNEDPGFADGPQHDEGFAGDTVSLLVPVYEPRPGAIDDGVVLELWYEGEDSLDIVVNSPAGQSLRVATGDSALAETADGAVFVVNALDGQAPNGDHAALVLLVDTDPARPPTQGTWSIGVEASALHSGTGGAFHAWLVGHTLDVSSQLPHFPGGTNRYLTEQPASADRVIAAAFYASRHRWTTLDGEPASFLYQEPLGDIAFLSSPGPRRDGVLKPDIAAPGKVVISALARNATLWEPLPYFVEADGVHVALLGSSMSAPQVAGAVALLFQLEPGLGPDEVREALVGNARQDGFTAHPYTGEPDATPNAQWGHGKLDAAAAASGLRPDGLAGPDRPIALSANPVQLDRLVMSYPDPPDRITIYTLTGRRVRAFEPAEIGPLTTIWPLDNDRGGSVANGPYLLVIERGGQRILEKILVARP